MFRDRHDAALRLARELRRFKGRSDALVLAVPRGGVPVGAALSSQLGLPLDAVLTKKIGHPRNPEFAIGAVSLTGEVHDEETARREGLSPEWIAGEVRRVRAGLRERDRRYHAAAPPRPVAGKTVILVDDGAATGRTLIVAIDLLRREGAARIVVALPVAPPDAVRLLEEAADEVVCLEVPEDFLAIGAHYEDFSQVSEEEAAALLAGAGAAGARGG